MIPKRPGKEKLMQVEGSFKKVGNINTCLCFNQKNRYVFCVMRRCQSKEYNLLRQFGTKHGAKYANLRFQGKQQIVQNLKGELYSQQKIFTESLARNEVAVTANFILAEEKEKRVHF